MLNGRHFLHVPGPTNIPERVIRAMTSTMEDQRGANFPKFTKPLYEDMKKIFKTKDGTVIMCHQAEQVLGKQVYLTLYRQETRFLHQDLDSLACYGWICVRD